MRTSRIPTVLCALLALAVLSGVKTPAARADEPEITLPNKDTIGPLGNFDVAQPKSDGDHRCSGEVAGWELVRSGDFLTPRRLEGDVVMGHPPHGDAVFNHDTEDHNFFVVPDDHQLLASDPTENYNYLLGAGNFGTGEPKEHGRIEVEWEYGAHHWNDADDANYYGFPTWAWPNTGDRAITEGFWAYDCGHHKNPEGADTGYRTEIHPPWFVATLRNMAQGRFARGENRHGWVAPLGSDPLDFSPVTKADVFISSFGGAAVEDLFDEDVFDPNDHFGDDWWQPVNRKDYNFDIPAPVKPSPDAQLVVKIQNPPGNYRKPPNAVEPAFSRANITEAPSRGGRTFVHVNIPMSTLPDSEYMLFAKSLIVGWDVPAPQVKHLRVTLDRWNVFEDLENIDEAEYSPWAQSGDQNIFVRISNGEDGDGATEFNCFSDSNYMPYCGPDNEENSFVDQTSLFAEPSFDRFVGPDDPLVVQFRAKEEDLPNENDDAGFAVQSFTSLENWGIGSHVLFQSDYTFAGEYSDFKGDALIGDSQPCEGEGPSGHRDSCFAVTYRIEQLIEPTTMTIGAPTVQYAQDPNLFTARVVSPGSPETPRRHLPVTLTLSDGTNQQILHGVTNDNGVAAPSDLLTLPAGTYTLTASFGGNGLLHDSSATQTVTIAKDFTSTGLDVAAKLRWGHQEPLTVTLLEPNVGQAGQTPNEPIAGKQLTITLTGSQGTQTYPIGPTGTDGKATITPLITLPPGNYQATACFAEDAWYRGSCSTPVPVKVTFGFASFARGGPINVSGGSNRATGDLHSEGSVLISGNSHVLSADPGERFEYVTTFSDIGTRNRYNQVQVPSLGVSPTYLRSTYCTGAPTFMGVPVFYATGGRTFKNDEKVNGIYCVDGDIKIQSRVTGKAVFLATGLITTSGSRQTLETADPTGADLLMLAGSSSLKAITIQSTDSLFKGALVATGGVQISSLNSIFDTGLLGSQVIVAGGTNLLKAPT
jgi:hypothetical protein